MMKKRLLSILLCLVMTVTLLPTAAMAAGRFTDVKETDWFYADVEYAVQLGLVNGTSTTTYSPNDNLTYSSAIKLAACMHKKVTQGNTDFTVGTPWYQVYVDYALANGIISASKTYDLDAYATRAGYMEIFAKAIPDTGLKRGYKALTAINRVDDGTIPDVPASHPQASAIYKLYRAGILQGSDTVTHRCNPDDYIQRSAVASILVRMMNPDARVKFEMIGDGGMSVTQQPADVDYLSAGGKAVFSTAVTGGKGPYTYKWYESYDDGANWTAIVNDAQYSGVLTKKLTVKLGPSDAYTGTLYRCQISDAAGHQVFTRSARVIVDNSPLTVVEHPADVTAESGEEVYFNAFAVGGKAPLSYQWQRRASDSDWQDFPIRNSGYETSKTNSLELVLSDIDFAAGYTYRCKITDAAGTTVYTNAAGLNRRNSKLTVTKQPQDVTCEEYDTVTFTVAVSGGKAPYTYQWETRNDEKPNWYSASSLVNVTRYNTPTLEVRIDRLDFIFNYQYRCKITDAAGSVVYSNPASAADANPSALTITQQPQNVTGKVGDWVSYSVVVSGGKAPYTYQWQNCTDDTPWDNVVNGLYLKGATTATLETQILAEDFAYNYQYRCKITDASGKVVYSKVVYPIEEAGPLTITQQPEDAKGTVGDQASFFVTVSGGKAPYTYEWQYCWVGGSWTYVENSELVGGATTSRLDIVITNDVIDSLYQYRCWVRDADNNFLCSDPVIVIEDTSPRIVSQPVSGSAAAGEKVTFTMEVSGGKSPCSYQWQYSTDGGSTWLSVANSTKYSGVQTSTLSVKIDSSDVASKNMLYRCRFTDSAHHTLYSNSVTATYRRPTVAN